MCEINGLFTLCNFIRVDLYSQPMDIHPNSKYKPEYAEQMRKMFLLGLRDVDVCGILGIGVQCLADWRHRYPEVAEATKNGKAVADAEVAASMYDLACGYSHPDIHISKNSKTGAVEFTPFMKHYKPDVVAQIFWLKNRQRDKWKDRQDVNVTGDPEITQLTDEELEAKKKNLLKQLEDQPLRVVK